MGIQVYLVCLVLFIRISYGIEGIAYIQTYKLPAIMLTLGMQQMLLYYNIIMVITVLYRRKQFIKLFALFDEFFFHFCCCCSCCCSYVGCSTKITNFMFIFICSCCAKKKKTKREMKNEKKNGSTVYSIMLSHLCSNNCRTRQWLLVYRVISSSYKHSKYIHVMCTNCCCFIESKSS